MGEFTIPAIQSGDQRVITTKLRLPSGIAEGTYSVGVILDPDKRLREYLLDNNASAGNPRLRRAQPAFTRRFAMRVRLAVSTLAWQAETSKF